MLRASQSLSRRELLKLSAAGLLGTSLSGWFPVLASRAAESGTKHKSCVLLWMDGGPSHIDTFDPKPDAPAEFRGEFKAIGTSAPGIQVSERFPKLAALMRHAALLRGMSTEEADHGRARIYMHTGYKPGFGGVTYPGLGSIVSAELGRPEFPLPNFVVTGATTAKFEFLTNPGYLGPRHQPLVLADPSRGLEDLQPSAAADDFQDRLSVLEQLEQSFARTYKAGAADAHRTTLGRAVQLIRSDKGKAFDLAQEPATARAAYGDTPFGRGCLLARRLVESGVPFVEVYLQNWDSHDQKVADSVKGLMTQVDACMAALLGDLKERGLLNSTLVIWMGEFGRTPRVNSKGGQVIGRTDRHGTAVEDRPISVRDFLATVCRVLGIDYTKKITTPNGRPIGIVDKGANPIPELFA